MTAVNTPPNTGGPARTRGAMSEDLLEKAVRGLRVADPDLGFKPLLAKLQEQQPELGAASKEVRAALTALKAESEAAKAATAAPPAAELAAVLPTVAPPAADGSGAPSNVALSLACIGCARLPSDMDDEREKHPICDMCRDQKLPTTYLCGVNCPANPGVWELHGAFHKKLRKGRKDTEDGGATQQRAREVAEEQARLAAQTGDEYDELLAEGAQYASKADWRKAARAYREAIALRPDEPLAYSNLGAMLTNSGHLVEAAQRFLQAKERCPVPGSEGWAKATAWAFNMLTQEECDEVAKPEWWNDEELKTLSAMVVRAAPNEVVAYRMQATVLGGLSYSWEVGPRSAAELEEAAAYFEQAAALSNAPMVKAMFTSAADACRSKAKVPWKA
eukprot:scaffold102614_cov63-Phaeocystis_antarctica.AAC.2